MIVLNIFISTLIANSFLNFALLTNFMLIIIALILMIINMKFIPPSKVNLTFTIPVIGSIYG